MIKLHKISLLLIFALTISFSLTAQKNFFSETNEADIRIGNAKRVIVPEKYKTVFLDVAGMKNFLWSTPSEKNMANRGGAPIMELPMPGGGTTKFRVWETSIMEPGLAAKYPEIKTFAGQGIDDPYATVQIDYNPYFGFSAQILSVKGNIYIDPYARGNINYYQSYYTHDYKRDAPFVCNTVNDPNILHRTSTAQAGPCRGTQLYSYRLALACTGEYAVAVAGANPSVANVLAAMISSVNRVDGVYESELSVRLILIANDDLLVYLDGTTDPYTNNNGSTMLGQNQTNIDAVIGTANYDIGHVFSTGGGGIAFLGVVCLDGLKAQGVTGLTTPVGDAFDIDYVAHEMGHEFGASHPFNGTVSNCGGGNRNASTAYEVGSGTTIMAYAGICGSNNIQPHSDPFFHAISFDEISTYLESDATCKVATSTGNNLPVITAMNNNGANIPINTPFTLTGSATDPDGDPLTYCWEEWDLGPAGEWNSGAADPSAPLFKSRVPKTTGSRTFPDINVILAGYPANPAATMGGLKGETLPTVARAMKFKLTVRDNRSGGGAFTSGGNGCQAGFTAPFQVNTIAGTGPFIVTAPNGGESYAGGSLQTITWNVAGTLAAPISCSDVKISLSTDGGFTYPTVIVASTPNDGTEVLAIPNITPTATARIKIEAIGNIFFDISDANFTITSAALAFDFDSPLPASIACGGPATTSGITLGTVSTGGYNTPITLSASNVPAGATITFGTNPVIPGSSSLVTLHNVNTLNAGTYNITITGVSGVITRTRVLAFTVLAGAGPVITVQPASQSICEGNNVTFSVTSPTALTYQWSLNPGGNTFTTIPGATNSSYTVNAVTAAQNNYQYLVVVNGQCNITNSNPAVLTVLTAPAITAQPQNATLCIGGSNTFSVTATGTGITYQWQLSTNGGVSFNDIGGATSSGYTLSGITTGMNNNQYRVLIGGTCTPAAASNAAVLTVISPVTITSQPANTEVCSGSDASFTVVGSSTQPIIYQWQVSTSAVPAFTNIPGANAATYTIVSTPVDVNGSQYRSLLSNAACTTPTVSNAASLTVRQLPTVGLTAAPLTSLLPGESTTLTATPSASTGGTLSTTWIYNTATVPNAGNTRTVNVEQIGNYQVRIQELWPGGLVCSNQSQVVAITAPASSRLFIFPNPNNGKFTVAYYNSGGASTQRYLTVYDSRGAKKFEGKYSIQGLYQLLSVDIQFSATGIYYVMLRDTNGKKIASGKLMAH
jgi:Metallo-peptidase family M12B Reprolysin-like/Secretion system C-terminal sorting domain